MNDHLPPGITPTGTTVVALPGDVDFSNVAEINDHLAAAFGPAVTTVIADLSATTFCDSSGLRELVFAYKLAAASHTELRVVVPAGFVARLLSRTGLDRLLAIYPTLQAAMTPEPLQQAAAQQGVFRSVPRAEEMAARGESTGN
jgi:anti-sigma B factor antagonist